MKFIGKVLLTLVLLLVLAIVLIYVLLQTRWAATQVSQWITGNSNYHLSVGKIDHGWSEPGRIVLNDVTLGAKNQPDALNAAQVNLDLSWRQITDPKFFDRITLINGRLNLNPSALNLPIQANTLQLNKMAYQRYANPLLNPFAWGSLIQQISKGKKGSKSSNF